MRARCMLVILAVHGCGGGEGPRDASDVVDVAVETDDPVEEEPWEPPPAGEDWGRDILSTGLVIDLATLTGTAIIELAESASTAASFEAQGLVVSGVSGSGGPLLFEVVGDRLDVGVPVDDPVIVVDYAFSIQDAFDGLLDMGATYIWPYYCGNLFPCHPEPADGLAFTLEILGVPEGVTAVYPEAIATDAPSYQIAWSVANHSYVALGTTSSGTEVGVWYLPGGETAAIGGTSYLLAAFDWYETALGPYPFGSRAGSVSVDWGPGAYAGMEHHPYWHVASAAMSDASVHVHEAAHGWYGGGVRIRCWEDFVLSEGTATYLTARVTGQVVSAAAETALWSSYETDLDAIVAGRDGIAWPDSCGEVDILLDGLFSQVPYIKGAYFYRAVAAEIGADALDAILASFFAAHAGQAAGMQDMLDAIQAGSGFDPADLATGWLRSLGRPDV